MRPTRDVVLVTGSSGFIGRPLAERLAERYDVVGFDRDGPPPHPPRTAECVCVDFASDDSVREALARVRYAYGERLASVIHLAAYYDFSGEPSEKYERITVRGTERLLMGLRDFQVEQFVFSSTMLVHAPCQPGERIDEGWPLDPKWDYPKSKVTTEELVRAERGRIPAVVLRIAGVYADRCHSVPLANQIQRIHERKLTSHLFPGDVTHGQAFVHLEDLLGALLALPERRAALPDELTLLVGEEGTLSYDELQRAFGRLIHDEEWETKEIPKAVAKAGAWVQEHVPGEEPFIKPWMIDLADDHYALDISRARRALEWSPRRSLGETLPKMVEALKQDPERFYRENRLDGKPSAGEGRKSPAYAERESTPEPHEPPHDMGAHQRMTLWAHFTVAAFGLWLMTAAATFAEKPVLRASDLVSGALLLVFGLLSASFRRSWPRWGSCAVGFWLLLAPLVFWAQTAATYASDTLVGAFAIALSILVPGMPGMSMSEGPEVPPGWSYNPSSWAQRAPSIALAFVGFFIARYLASFQLHHVSAVWDPVFGAGTRRVLTSDVSRAWPISDAGLGALSYLLEVLSGFMGGKDRWRTMPWMVAMFGLLVVPLGVTSIVLVMLQPVAVGAWCTLCLVTAIAMLAMVPLAVDEVVAMGQFLRASVRGGAPFWHTFWMGGTIEGGGKDERSPQLGSKTGVLWGGMTWGVGLPWNLVLGIALGVAAMLLPALTGSRGVSADVAHVSGALVVTCAAIALAEVARAARFLNVLLGAGLAVSPWVVAGATSSGRLAEGLVGAAIVALSLRRGAIKERYGSFQRLVV